MITLKYPQGDQEIVYRSDIETVYKEAGGEHWLVKFTNGDVAAIINYYEVYEQLQSSDNLR